MCFALGIRIKRAIIWIFIFLYGYWEPILRVVSDCPLLHFGINISKASDNWLVVEEMDIDRLTRESFSLALFLELSPIETISIGHVV